MRAGGRGEQVSAPFWSHCTARRRENDTTHRNSVAELGSREAVWYVGDVCRVEIRLKVNVQTSNHENRERVAVGVVGVE